MPWGPQPQDCTALGMLGESYHVHMLPSCCPALPRPIPALLAPPDSLNILSSPQRSSWSRDPKAPSETGDSWKPGLPWCLVGVMPQGAMGQ